MTTPRLCTCENPKPAAVTAGHVDVCYDCGKAIRRQSKGGTIPPEDVKFAEWLIRMEQTTIKQSQRKIHEIRERYGLRG